jgi:hypothetical protein
MGISFNRGKNKRTGGGGLLKCQKKLIKVLNKVVSSTSRHRLELNSYYVALIRSADIAGR